MRSELVGNYLSNLKWIGMSFPNIVSEVTNWGEVLAYYLSPVHKSSLKVLLKNGDILSVPKYYIFEAVAETLLMNVYNFEISRPDAVIVDIGASIGDFTLIASRNPSTTVYAFEPKPEAFRFLKFNISSNKRGGVRLFNASADVDTLESIIQTNGELRIDFLKVDCEGCEYELLLECPAKILAKIDRISMEIHDTGNCSKLKLTDYLTRTGFCVHERRSIGHGHYLYANRKVGTSNSEFLQSDSDISLVFS